jgi:hypothetical protein
MPVAPAGFDERSWKRWLLDQIILVEQHEACEFFRVDSEVVFPPNHGPGRDSYSIREMQSPEDAVVQQAPSYVGAMDEWPRGEGAVG